MLEGQFQVVEHRQPAGGRSRPFLVAAPLPGPWRIVCGSCPVPLRFAASYLRARRYVIGLPQEGRPRGLLFAAPPGAGGCSLLCCLCVCCSDTATIRSISLRRGSGLIWPSSLRRVIENEWLLGLSGLASSYSARSWRPAAERPGPTAVRAVIGEPVLGLQDLGCACGAGGDERGLRRAQAFAADRLDVGYPSGVRRSPCRCAEATPHPE
jgi:hypothetical protein